MGMGEWTLLENTGNATEYYVAQPGRIINRLIDPCEDLYLRSDLDKKTEVFLFKFLTELFSLNNHAKYSLLVQDA